MTGRFSADQFDPRLEALSRGWNPNASGPRVAASVIARLLGCPATYHPEVSENIFRFTLDLSCIRLRGMEDVPCFLAGGASPDVADQLRTIVRAKATPAVCLIWTTSDRMYDLLVDGTTGQRCVVMGRDQIRRLHGADPLDTLTRQIRTALPRRSLIPYDILLSATGGMFYGRFEELSRLCEEDLTSFAIVGPGRVGKTSLVKSYIRWLAQERPERRSATFLIDLMACPNKSADGYASFIASRISPRRGRGVGSAELATVMSDQANAMKQSINLILDEADDICLDRSVLMTLGIAARDGAVRVVLCGKGDLFRTVLDQSSHFANRLELLRLGPLDDASARNLLLEPLAALGVSFAEAAATDEIIWLTGRFPHLIQLYARHLAEYAIREHQEQVTTDVLAALRWDDELAQYFVSPVQDMRDPASRLVALTLLRDRARDAWTASEVVSKVEGIGLQRARDLLNELVISNILTWYGDSFRLANQALRVYADHLGVLDAEYEEALGHYSTKLKGRSTL
jgi:hypothetical protein